jgi:hypothetical protein
MTASTCPFTDEPPAQDTFCHDWIIVYGREASPRELRDAPWALFAFHSTFTWHADGSFTPASEGFGVAFDPIGTFDEKRYTTATVSGTVPTSDGGQVAVDLAWDMSLAELNHGGNNSAFNVVNGIDRHVNDRCLTLIHNAHQQWRSGPPGVISGTIDGHDVDSLYRPDFEPFIAGRSHFTVVTVEHGGCAGV